MNLAHIILQKGDDLLLLRFHHGDIDEQFFHEIAIRLTYDGKLAQRLRRVFCAGEQGFERLAEEIFLELFETRRTVENLHQLLTRPRPVVAALPIKLLQLPHEAAELRHGSAGEVLLEGGFFLRLFPLVFRQGRQDALASLPPLLPCRQILFRAALLQQQLRLSRLMVEDGNRLSRQRLFLRTDASHLMLVLCHALL